MTSGAKRFAEAALALCAAASLAAAAAAPLDAAALMRMLASVQSTRATFVETRYSRLLKAPLVSRGTLTYRRPDRLEKHVESPREERLVLDGGRLSIELPDRGRTLSIEAQAAPGVGTLIEGLRAVRAGDLGALERHFSVAVHGTREAWRLELEPRSPGVAQYVQAVSMAGAGARLERIEVREASGDRTVTEISEHAE